MTEANEQSTNDALRIILLVLGTLSLIIILPFLQAVLAAGLVAYLVTPINDRLSHQVGPTAGVLVTMLVTLAVVILPFLLLILVAIDQAGSLLRGAELTDLTGVEILLQQWLGMNAPRLSEFSEPISEAIKSGAQGILGSLVGVLSSLPGGIIAMVVFLFTLYSLLRNGDQLMSWFRTAIPLEQDVMDELLSRADDLLWAGIVGNIIVAAIQAVLTVLGFLILGFNDLVFWGVATFALSLLPVIGASIVWIPATIYLGVVGDLPAAIGLLVYGSVFISGSDNFIRPLAMQRGTDLNTGVLVLDIFGGVGLFGFIGLFIGPVLLGLSKVTVDLLVENRETSESS